MTTTLNSYATFIGEASRRDLFLYEITLDDNTGTSRTLYWSRGVIDSTLYADVDDVPIPRVLEGGIDYQSPQFDPHNPSYGIESARAPSPIIALQLDGDLDQYKSWKWSGASISVKHGGWSDRLGWVPVNLWRTINTAEVDGWPRWDLDRMTIPLRSKEARFDVPVERRVLAALDWCIEGNGTDTGVSFNPHSAGVGLRTTKTRGVASGGPGSQKDVTVELPPFEVGDLVVIWLSTHGFGGSPYIAWTAGTPSGWTSQSPSVATVGGVGAVRLYCFTRVAAGGDPTSVTITGTGTADQYATRTWQAEAWYGQHASTPVPASAEAHNSDSAATSATAPTVTTANDDDVLATGFATAYEAHALPPWGQGGDPAVMTDLDHTQKKTTTTNRSTLDTYWERIAAAGATGTRVIPRAGALSPSSRQACISLVIGNRVSTGVAPTKLALLNSMSVQFAFVPMAIGAVQHLLGWYTSPFRAYLDASGHLCWSWEKATATVTKTSAFTFVADRRYHVEIIHTDTLVTLIVYDWRADTETVETFAGTGFNSRDSYESGVDEFTLLSRRQTGEAGEDYYDGQLWSLRIWSGTVARATLADRRMRRLTEVEELDATLILYLPMDEKSGERLNDRSPAPAAGYSVDETAFEWRPTLTGQQDQAGLQMPNVWGYCEGVPLLMVESAVDGAMFVAHPTEIDEFVRIAEGAMPRQIDEEAETYRDFLDTLPDPGTWTVYRGGVGSFARCRTIPTLPITAEVRGDAFGGTYVETAMDIVRRVITIRGDERVTDPGELNTASIDALNTACPSKVGTMVGEGETIKDLARRVLGTIGAIGWPKRDGDFYFQRFEGDGGSTTRDIDRYVYAVGTAKEIDVALPADEVAYKYRRNWLQLARNQISGDIDPATQPWVFAFALRDWQIVTARRGSVTDDFRRARKIAVESYFTRLNDAGTEANRIADLFDTPPQWIELSVRRIAEAPLELLDQVQLDVTDLDQDNVIRQRLGTNATTFVVTGVADKGTDGLEHVRLWRKDGTI